MDSYTYTYDALNRLSTVTEPGGRTTEYTYDESGNRLTEKTVENGVTTLEQYTYDSRNRLTEIDKKENNVLVQVTTYTYDKNGNQLTTKVDTYEDGTIASTAIIATYTYDYRNQLIKSITQEGTVENTYNGEGYRVAKTVDGVKTSFLYDGDKVVLEVDASGNQIARNVYGINLLMRNVDGESYYYMYNGHGDVTALIDKDGEVAATYYYDAFGNVIESSGDINNFILYSGYQYDEETELYYLNARMYDPKIARFLQEDTYRGELNDPLSLNLYTYCFNNPIIYDDPTGCTVDDFITGMANAIDDNLTGGFLNWIVNKMMGVDHDYQYDDAFDYYLGRVVGDILAMGTGVGSIVTGYKTIKASITGGGAITYLSGGLLTIGGYVIVVSGVTVGAAEITYGGVVAIAAAGNFGSDLSKLNESAKKNSQLTPKQLNEYKSQVLSGNDVHFKTKEEALDFINKKFPDLKQEVAGSRSAEGWHFDSHPIGGSANSIEHINIYSKKQVFRVHITWG